MTPHARLHLGLVLAVAGLLTACTTDRPADPTPTTTPTVTATANPVSADDIDAAKATVHDAFYLFASGDTTTGCRYLTTRAQNTYTFCQTGEDWCGKTIGEYWPTIVATVPDGDGILVGTDTYEGSGLIMDFRLTKEGDRWLIDQMCQGRGLPFEETFECLEDAP